MLRFPNGVTWPCHSLLACCTANLSSAWWCLPRGNLTSLLSVTVAGPASRFSLTLQTCLLNQRLRGKKDNGAATVHTRSPRKVATKAKVSAVTQRDLDISEAARDTETVVNLGLDMMMTMLLDLTNKVNGQEEASPVELDSPSPTPAKPRPVPRKSRWQNTSAQHLDLDETVWRWVEQHLWQIPLLGATISQENSPSDDEPVVKRKRRNLKSGRGCMGAMSVKNWITWPHELIYGADGQPAAYKDLFISGFVRGYLIVLQNEWDTQVKEH